MVPGALVLPIGLLLSGWAAEKRLHWIVTDIVGFSMGSLSSINQFPPGYDFGRGWNDFVLSIDAGVRGRYIHFVCRLRLVFSYWFAATSYSFLLSALAAVSCLRSLAGFGFPLFAPKMYSALGYGWGMTVLAIVSMVLGWPA